MKTTVYRIEDSLTKCGMYGSGGCREADFGYEHNHHPAPEEDTLLASRLEAATGESAWSFSYGAYHFGFASLDQLRNWIYRDKWLLALHESGHVLAIIESEEVFAGYTQVVFKRPETYQTVSIKEFFEL